MMRLDCKRPGVDLQEYMLNCSLENNQESGVPFHTKHKGIHKEYRVWGFYKVGLKYNKLQLVREMEKWVAERERDTHSSITLFNISLVHTGQQQVKPDHIAAQCSTAC